jgi:hypothetical protein
MKIYQIEDLRKIQQEQQYKYVGLFDYNGAQIIPFNPNRVTNETRLREIETRLISQGLPDGYYIVKCKNSTGKNVKTDDYTFYKGEKLGEIAPPAPVVVQAPAPTAGPEVLTYEGALKLQVELERLKLENNNLKQQIEDLKNELSEIETLGEENKETAGMWDNAKSFLSELVSVGAPLLDKHFELREKSLALKALEIQSKAPAPRPTNNPDQRNKEIQIFIKSYQEDEPEIYEELVKIYNSASNQADFMEKLAAYDQELFNELQNG